ncbi:hypothetical protein D7V83_00805 [bacterium 0.1xD8-71]|nr:hypothetical protein D7V83_00805 [bacterium 0.1xD8-71]
MKGLTETMTGYTATDDKKEERLQREYMEKAALHVAALKEELGRVPRGCVVTFGCQMNTEREIEKAAKMRLFLFRVEI